MELAGGREEEAEGRWMEAADWLWSEEADEETNPNISDNHIRNNITIKMTTFLIRLKA